MNDQALDLLIKKRHGFSKWLDRNTLDENLFIWKLFLTRQQLKDWHAGRIERLEAPPSTSPSEGEPFTRPPNLVRSFWRRPEDQSDAVHRIDKIHARDLSRPDEEAVQPPGETTEPPALIRSFWRHSAESPAVLNLNIFECSSRIAAHQFLITVLSQFQSPLLTRRDDLGVGDVAFAMPGSTIVIFARGNLVHVLRNAGSDVVPVESVAREFDTDLISKPIVDEPETARRGAVPEISRASLTVKQLRVGIPSPLDIEAADSLRPHVETPLRAQASAPLERGESVQARPIMYKIFSPREGSIFRQQQRLFYQTQRTGVQDITLFAINANRVTSSSRLTVEAA